MARILTRSHTFAGRSGSRRATEWFASSDVTAPTALPAASFVLLSTLSAGQLAKRPFTVTRTVGSIFVSSDQAAAVEKPFGAMGMIVVSDKASATGATAIPDPITDEGSDEWFAYRFFAAENHSNFEGTAEFQFDSRGQRRVEDGEDIAVLVSNAAAAAGLDFILKFRILVKLN